MGIDFRSQKADEEPAASLLAAMVEELAAMYGKLSLDQTPSATPDELWAPGGTFLVGYDDGRAIACGGIKRLGDGMAEIKRMYVVPDARGRGHARRLLAALEFAATDLGYERIRLDTGPKQPQARALYEKAGYAAIPDYNDNRYATHWFEKRIES